ncbi:chromosome segregation DNA-binding protein [Nitrosomonas sp. PY1]|uniref:ParB/RepB/Spo0J family partition protein n=1 Tax=Nitrosomonas sp. PY1 TaxID=1803906 RepID=UPI001FC868A6|nr:ParB/RepB/Spo0J family partition protein [Nitrosomonas sp. PY1]GKS70402.1 chromosome segregation DNA-binding protein [Nitrosomonas sp. PY1]
MSKLKGLGRGLDALLAGHGIGGAVEESLQNLDISQLQPGKYQPRTNMDQIALSELAESIKAQGVMQPILVRPITVDQYEIIAGERRWRAAQLAGLNQVPALIRKVADESALAMSLIENIQRENLNPLEEAMGIQRLINEFGMTHESAGEALGNSRSTISNLLRLLNLSAPVQDMMMAGKIEMGHGRALLSLSPAEQIKVVNAIVQKQLSVRETEKIVNRINRPLTKIVKKIDRDLLRLEEEISQRLGTQVTIKAKKNGHGNIIIQYSNLDQLDDILNKL